MATFPRKSKKRKSKVVLLPLHAGQPVHFADFVCTLAKCNAVLMANTQKEKKKIPKKKTIRSNDIIVISLFRIFLFVLQKIKKNPLECSSFDR
jgi:hypothetical protein